MKFTDVIKKVIGVVTAFITLFFLMLALIPTEDGEGLTAFGLVFAAIFGVITFFLLFYKSGIRFGKSVVCPKCGKKHYPEKGESQFCPYCRIKDLQEKLDSIGYTEYEQVKKAIDDTNKEIENKNSEISFV